MRPQRGPVLAFLSVTWIATGLGWAAAGQVAPGPRGLSVRLTDHVHRVHPHMLLTYTAALANSGPATVRATLRVKPPPEGALAGRHRTKTWHVKVRPGHTVRRHVKVRIHRLPLDATRVTTRVKVVLGRHPGAPVLRTRDADAVRVRAAAKAAEAVRAAPPAPVGSSGWGFTDTLWVGIPAAALAVIVLAFAAVRDPRERRSTGTPSRG